MIGPKIVNRFLYCGEILLKMSQGMRFLEATIRMAAQVDLFSYVNEWMNEWQWKLYLATLA